MAADIAFVYQVGIDGTETTRELSEAQRSLRHSGDFSEPYVSPHGYVVAKTCAQARELAHAVLVTQLRIAEEWLTKARADEQRMRDAWGVPG